MKKFALLVLALAAPTFVLAEGSSSAPVTPTSTSAPATGAKHSGKHHKKGAHKGGKKKAEKKSTEAAPVAPAGGAH